MDTLKTYVIKRKKTSFNPRKPKAHTLQAGAVYACDRSICGHSEDFSSSNESVSKDTVHTT